MFKKLFGSSKNNPQTEEVLVAEEPIVGRIGRKTNYPKEVYDIHYAFDIAGEKLVEEAKRIINDAPIVNESKLERLAKFGFKQVKEIEEGTKVLNETKLSKEQIDLVNYYKQKYPFNKFITEPQVKEICHKYNLVCGDVERFRGFVPDSNLKDIENFKLHEEDNNFLLCRDIKTGETFELENASIKIDSGYGHIYDNRKNYDWHKNSVFQSDGRNFNLFYSDDKLDIFGLKDKGDMRFEVENKSLKICAPVKDMDLTGLELIEGYKLQKKHIPDPVILHPVKGGYLIITAWGDEASDSLVVNENFN